MLLRERKTPAAEDVFRTLLTVESPHRTGADGVPEKSGGQVRVEDGRDP